MRTLAIVVALGLAAMGGCAKDKADSKATATEEQKLPEMTLDEVDQALAANAATAVDCNGDRTRKKSGVLPGAILISDEEAYPVSELPADKTRKLVFYCADPG
jgi:hypothetical protein